MELFVLNQLAMDVFNSHRYNYNAALLCGDHTCKHSF